MPSVGILILLVIAGTWMCIKARAAGPAAVFAGLTVLFIVSTPVGAVLPGAVGNLFSVVDSATSPVMNGQQVTTAGARR
jgi:hypothetical protein